MLLNRAPAILYNSSLEAGGVDDGDVGSRPEPPAGAEGGHLGLGPEPVADLEGEPQCSHLVTLVTSGHIP